MRALSIVAIVLAGTIICGFGCKKHSTSIISAFNEGTALRTPSERYDVPRAPLSRQHQPNKPTTAANFPTISIVLDDVGLRRNAHDPFLAIRGLRGALSWALLPGAVHSIPIARELVDLGESLLLHMPMEPAKAQHIAPHLGRYLLSRHTHEEISAILSAAYETFPLEIRPHLAGLNNHQGSRLTMSRTHMSAVVASVKARNGYILDSRTSGDSVLVQSALEQSVPARSRDVFLDNIREIEAIREQLTIAEDVALANGSAIAICHPYPETAQALAQWVHERNQTIKLVPVRALMRK